MLVSRLSHKVILPSFAFALSGMNVHRIMLLSLLGENPLHQQLSLSLFPADACTHFHAHTVTVSSLPHCLCMRAKREEDEKREGRALSATREEEGRFLLHKYSLLIGSSVRERR